MDDTRDPVELMSVLERLADALAAVRLRLRAGTAIEGERARTTIVEQVHDYLLPRLRQLDAPLLMVVGGSTGAGKSTLVNALVGEQVSTAGVLRPTTRSPILVVHPADLSWFDDQRVLPELARTTGGDATGRSLRLVETERIGPGIALLDAPDIDSVVEENRQLAAQLLAAADAWLFVTTAARYADAVPWDMLERARERGTALSLVLDRVAPDVADEVAEHLRSMTEERGLAGTSIVVVPEVPLAGGLLPGSAVVQVRAWLEALTQDAQARAGVVGRTLSGAIDSLPTRLAVVRDAVAEQHRVADELRRAVESSYAQAVEEVDATIRSGALLRGEVLARWHDVIGTGDLMRALESRIGRARDRIRSFVTGSPPPEVELQGAVKTGVDAVVLAAADRAAERAAGAWRRDAAGRVLLDGVARADAASSDLDERVDERVRQWQGEVLDLVRTESEGKRATARLASLGINAAGLTVMIAVFASTGGLTGAEVAVAGGTSALSQKVLEAVFGDQAVRTLAERARERLLSHVRELLDEEAARLLDLLEAVAPAEGLVERLDAAGADLERVR